MTIADHPVAESSCRAKVIIDQEGFTQTVAGSSEPST